MNYSICIDSVFRGIGQEAALERVKACGFRAFEFWSWWDRDLDALQKKAAALGLECATFCQKFISLTDPARREDYVAALKESIAAAKKLGTKALISQLGDDTGAVRPFQHRSIVAGLKAAAPLLEESGVTLLIEPLNGHIDHPGTYLEYSDEGFEIVDEVGSGNVKLLFDIYHQQITEGNIIQRITKNINRIGHFHSAGNPGRHELDRGELDYRRIFNAAAGLGYQGFIGVEYFPAEDAETGLKRLYDYLKS
jgi:hydroxypyruvate isomerase